MSTWTPEPQRIRRRVSREARRLLVLGYKAAGLADRQIVEQIREDHNIGVSYQTVNNDWHQALFELTEQITPKAAELRTLHTVRLEALLAAAWGEAIGGSLEAIRTCLYIMVQIKNIQGLDKQPVLVYEKMESVQIFTEDDEFDWSTVPDSDLKLLVEIVNAARREPLALEGPEIIEGEQL